MKTVYDRMFFGSLCILGVMLVVLEALELLKIELPGNVMIVIGVVELGSIYALVISAVKRFKK